ncbi:MAG TPA: DUF3892 domain-containing protein [Puia sp.]|jgi:hypothetical protein
MSRHQVTCITKKGGHYNAHERITNIGGTNANGTPWKLTEDDAIKGIENKTYEFYVTVNQKTVDVVVAIHGGRKYLKTIADGYSPDNLLALLECK